MGFKPPRKVYRIIVEDGVYAGLEARVGGVPLGQYLDLTELAESGITPENVDQMSAEDAAKSVTGMRILLNTFAEKLIDWNLENEDDTPIPATREALMAQDFDMAMLLVNKWMEAMGGVSGPLSGTPSGAGSSSDEGSPLTSLADQSQPLSGVPS